MIRWNPDTCFCSILCERPGKEGSFELRCRIHQTSRTLEVYAHNIANKSRQFTGTGKDKRPTDSDVTRRQTLRDSTRP